MSDKKVKTFQEAITPINMNDNTPNGNMEILDRVINEVFNTKDLDLKTDLSMEQINAITRVEMYNEVFEIPILNSLTTKLKRLLISKDRKGREEFTRIVTKNLGDEEDENPSMFNKLIKGIN